jgi:hypothetical protein
MKRLPGERSMMTLVLLRLSVSVASVIIEAAAMG